MRVVYTSCGAAAIALLVACPPPANAPSGEPGPGASATGTATTAPPPGPPRALGAFVRERPQTMGLRGPDACAYLGGMGFACLDALLAEKDPVVRRWMRRLSDAHAKLDAAEPSGVPHAEIAMCCAEAGPCRNQSTSPECGNLDDGYACLTAAERAREEDPRASKNAHARACRCDARRAQIPIMGGTLACDGAAPVVRGQNLTDAEAREVDLCGLCDAEKGPRACAAEIARQRRADPELASWLEQVHTRRCESR